MKVTVPNLKASQGVSFTLLDDGTYKVEVNKATIGDASTGRGFLKLEMTVLDGKEQKDGKSPVGRKVFQSLYFPTETDQKPEIFTDRIKSACDAFGVAVNKNDAFDNEEFIGKESLATIRTKLRTKKNPEDPDVYDNEVKYFKPIIES